MNKTLQNSQLIPRLILAGCAGIIFFGYGLCGNAQSASQDPVQAAIEATARRTSPQTQWFGPTSGPRAATGKKIVCINADSKNPIENLWGNSVAEAAKTIGWEVSVLDGKGTVDGQIAALNQAIALNPQGIVTSANVAPLLDPLTVATSQGILVVGIHASAMPGPDPAHHLLYNITSSGKEIGNALADYIIADSKGKGRAIILYDAQYAIARLKAESMKQELSTCPGCKLLDYVNSPLNDVATQMPRLGSAWVTRFGPSFYVMTIADYYYDFLVPSLRTGVVGPDDVKLLGSDGTPEAFNRVRSGNYQVATVPEPATLQGYQAVDALNRAFQGEKPVDFQQPVYLVVKQNVDKEGGDKNLYDPSNNYRERYLKIWKPE